MDSKKAVELLGDWVEYLSNTRQGSYKTVELEYEDAQQIAELIQQQEKMIKLAIKELATRRGRCVPRCPDAPFCSTEKNRPCVESWRKYLESEVSK